MGSSPSRKSKSLDPASQLLVNPSASLLRLLYKCTSHAVSPEEIKYLATLYTDLAGRSAGGCIDKGTFLMFFPLPVQST